MLLAGEGGAFLFICVAILAAGACIVFAVTIDAARHRRDVRNFCHDFHLRHLAVTHFAGHLRFEMRSMIPIHPARHHIDANPGNGLIRFRKLRELLNGGFVFGNRHMAGHAFAGSGESHAVAGFRIDVALLTFQPECQVLLVTVGNGLHGRIRLRRGTIFALRSRYRHPRRLRHRRRRLLRRKSLHPDREQKKQEQNQARSSLLPPQIRNFEESLEHLLSLAYLAGLRLVLRVQGVLERRGEPRQWPDW